MKTIYLDNAATTRVDPEVLKVMLPYFQKKYGNASEFHRLGMEARLAIEEVRGEIAMFLGGKPSEIIFTSSATESINLALKGLIESLSFEFKKGETPHIITSKIEHKAVLETCKHLEKSMKADITYLDVDKQGRIDLESLQKAIKPQTVLVSIMYANNEVGTIEPIAKIGKILKKLNNKRIRKIFFHTDATQAMGYLNCNVDYLAVDMLSFTGHKINAPKGIGALYLREGSSIIRQLDGGSQEGRMRAGTENTPYIVGLGKAIEIVKENRIERTKKIGLLRDRLIKGVLKIPSVSLTGHPIQRLPHIASFLVGEVEGEAMVLALSELGIIASTGSACTSSDLAPSHVLSAMGIPPEQSHGSLRFSLGGKTKKEDIDYVIDQLPAVIERLREMAPKL